MSVVDVNEERLESLKSELTDSSRIMFTKCDVSNEQAVKSAIEETVKKFGKLDVTLCCAGILESNKLLTDEGV